MELLNNYIEIMFSQLPDTIEIKEIKNTIRKIMENKYMEYMYESCTRNESVELVMLEYISLTKVVEELGVKNIIKKIEPLSDDYTNVCNLNRIMVYRQN